MNKYIFLQLQANPLLNTVYKYSEYVSVDLRGKSC